jgi:hypothetical protein
MDPTLAASFGVMPGTTIAVDETSAAWPAGSFGAASGSGTGAHGITPTTFGGGGMADTINQVWAWLNTPFTQKMSPVNVALLVGVVIIAIMFWNLLLYHVRIAAETI